MGKPFLSLLSSSNTILDLMLMPLSKCQQIFNGAAILPVACLWHNPPEGVNRVIRKIFFTDIQYLPHDVMHVPLSNEAFEFETTHEFHSFLHCCFHRFVCLLSNRFADLIVLHEAGSHWLRAAISFRLLLPD